MRIALVNNGPIAVSFEVYDDFLHYSGGIYRHTFFKDEKNFRFNPFELTNHVGKYNIHIEFFINTFLKIFMK